MTFNALCDLLRQQFGSDSFSTSQFRDNYRILLKPERLMTFLKFLKEDLGFDMLFELAGVDYLTYPDAHDRFGVIYGLLNTTTGQRVFVKTFVNEPEPTLPSVFDLWKVADWMEREIYDMFGIVFEGHPNLRRILLPPEFTSYPLRKDYPLRGRGERHNFPVISRAES